MTVAAVTPVIRYIGTGAIVPLDIPFSYEANSHIVVTAIVGGVETVLTAGTHYTLADNVVTPVAAIAEGTTWQIERVTPRSQPTEYNNGDDWNSAGMEAAFDRMARIDQEQDATLSRAVKVPAGASAPVLDIADLEDAEGMAIGVVGGKLAAIPSDATEFASEIAAAAAYASSAGVAATAAAAANVEAGGHANDAETAASEALTSKNAAQLAALFEEAYSNASASNVPKKVTAATITAAGSGGTNGTFALAFSGGNFAANPTGTFTVSGGAVTAITITSGGRYEGASATAPTVSFAASSGLTGATATLTVGDAVGSGKLYFALSADSSAIQGYVNNAGAPAAVSGLSFSSVTGNTLALPLSRAALALPAPVFGMKGYRLALALGVAANLVSDPIVGGGITDVVTFTRASAAVDFDGTTYVSFASSAAVALSNGVAIRRDTDQLVKQAQDCNVSPWSVAGIASRASSGTGPLGVNKIRVTEDTSTGQHRITQASMAMTAGQVRYASMLFYPETCSEIGLSLSGAAFTGNAPGVVFNTATENWTVYAGTPVSYGALQRLDGSWLMWLAATVTTTGNGSVNAYLARSGSVTHTGTSRYFDFVSMNVGLGRAPLPQMLNATTSVGTPRAADGLSVPVAGTAVAFEVTAHSDATRCEDGHIATLRNTSTGALVALRYHAGKVQLYTNDGSGNTQTADWGTATGTDALALAYDSVAGTVRGSMNSTAINDLTLTHAPTGLDKLWIGQDGAGDNFGNAVYEYSETAHGAPSDATLLKATGGDGAGGVTPATGYDTSKIVIVATSTRVRVFVHAHGGTDTDWYGFDWEYRAFAANRSLGWAQGKVALYTRAGEFSFTEVDVIVNAGSANDDSTLLSGAAANAFMAIMDEVLTPTTGHGFREAIAVNPAYFYADGVVFDPATAGSFEANGFRATQVSIGLDPTAALGATYDTVGKWCDGWQEWRIFGGDYEYHNRLTVTEAKTIKAGSYLCMTDFEDMTGDYAAIQEQPGVFEVGGTVDTIETAYPWARRFTDRHVLDFQVLSGWRQGDSTISVQDSNTSSARGKVYYQYRDADFTVAPGDVLECIVRQRWSVK